MVNSFENSLLKNKLPTTNPNNIPNVTALTDNNPSNVYFQANQKVTFVLDGDYDINEYVFGSSGGAKISLIDSSEKLITELPSTSNQNSVVMKKLDTPVLKVRKIEILNTSVNQIAVGEINLWGEISRLNKFLILSNDNEIISFKKGKISENLVPEMTSNTAPSGVVEASSSNASYLPFNAFNSSTTSVWLTNVTTIGWISYQFIEVKNIKKYSLRGSTIARLPKDWAFEGWNGNSWDVLDTRTNITNWQVNVFNEFTISNDKNYFKYRLNVSSNNGDANYLTLNGFMMFESADDELIILNSNSQDKFITHGMNKSTQIDLNSSMTNKVFIEQNPTVLGSGKVFSKTIDTTKTPIKKVTIK